jgi:hypothetical protein
MKKLTLKEQYNHHLEYTNDIDRIVKIFADRGYEISHTDACRAWEYYSDGMCAGWMILDEDDEVFMDVFCYFEEV